MEHKKDRYKHSCNDMLETYELEDHSSVSQIGNTEVFVSGITAEMHMSDLNFHFFKYGLVIQVRLFHFGDNHNLAFIKYNTRAEACRAVEMLDKFEIKSKSFINVSLSKERSCLILKNVCQAEEALKKTLEPDVQVKSLLRTGCYMITCKTPEAARILKYKVKNNILPGFQDVSCTWNTILPEPSAENRKRKLTPAQIEQSIDFIYDEANFQAENLEGMSSSSKIAKIVKENYDYEFDVDKYVASMKGACSSRVLDEQRCLLEEALACPAAEHMTDEKKFVYNLLDDFNKINSIIDGDINKMRNIIAGVKEKLIHFFKV